MILACDIDNVVVDTAAQTIAICKRRRRPAPSFDRYHDRAVDATVLEELALGGYAQAKPYPAAASTLIKWMVAWGAQRPILFVTARPISLTIGGQRIAVHDQTVKSLHTLGLGDYLDPRYGYAEVHSIGSTDKIDYLLDLGYAPDQITLLDDRGSTCAKAHELGLHPIVYDQPWNQYLCHGLPRAVGWKGPAGVEGLLELA